jgi:SAM-dependent methyltransferase
VRENPRAAEGMFRQVVWACGHDTPYPGDAEARLLAPDKKTLLVQNRRERERLRRANAPAESEVSFWSGYLKKYRILEKSTDYRAYLQLIGSLCGTPQPGALVLDAGCGNGMFGRWMIREAWSHVSPAGGPPPVYVGLDLTVQGLADALAGQLGVRRPLPDAPGLQYAVVDFDRLTDAGGTTARLPFQEGMFDVICCSLVLSYLKRPQALLGELHRVLRPGGRFVVSSMKPHCDLSVIYRDSIGRSVTDGDIDAGRDLLRAAGTIKIKEETGHYTFYSPARLACLVMDAGFNVKKSSLSLGNQAAVIQATK